MTATTKKQVEKNCEEIRKNFRQSQSNLEQCARHARAKLTIKVTPQVDDMPALVPAVLK